MNNTVKRLLLFFIAIPGFFLLIVYLPQFNHLALNVFLIVSSVIGTYELCNMMKKFGYSISTVYFPLLGAILPIGSYLEVLGILSSSYQSLLLSVLLIAGFIFPVFQNSKKEMGEAFRLLMSYLTAGIYPSFFVAYIVRFSMFEQSTALLILFMFLVFLNDSMAWFFGKYFGKKRNLLAASPNKSIAGFAGGIGTSIAVMILARWIFPEILPISYWLAALAGTVFGFTTIIGDLVESAIKRSVGVKDSGNIIMGRGGMLDSIDSLLITAPVYFYFFAGILT